MKLHETLGFVGLGSMGSKIARRLLDTGYHLIVFDVNPEALRALGDGRYTAVGSPREVASQAEVVLVCLPTPEAVRAVALNDDGIIHGDKVRIYVDLSTTGPVMAQEVARQLGPREIACIDSPVSGGLGVVAQGGLALMVAGKTAVVEEMTPILQKLGKPAVMGEAVGLGHMMKLLNNLLSGTAIAITAEAMVLGVKAGLDPELMLKALNMGSGHNCATEERFPNHVLNRTFNNGFSNALMRKDVRLCLEAAEKLQVPLWVGTAVDRLWMQAVVQLGGEKGTTSIVQIVEAWAGVEVVARPKTSPVDAVQR